jgi:methionine synthase II (cobalamin-independent)
MFSRAARTALDRNRLMVSLAESVLRPAIDAAVGNGSQLIHLEDPWIGYHGIAPQDWAPLRDALETLHRGLKATLVFHVYFGDAGPYISELRRLPVDAIGVDLIETDVAELGSGWEKGLVAGVMNGRQSLVESAESIIEIANHLADTVRPSALYLTSNCELAFLPTSVAERKVKRLGEAATKVKELVSV